MVGCERPRTKGPPDIILITVDTLRPDHLGAYGHEAAKTPNIDALANEGATFVNAFAPMGRTTPSVASMMTGLWPHEHGSREVRVPIERGTVIASSLKESGYATVGVSANPAAGRGQGLAAGFDAFVEVGDEGPDERWNAEDTTDEAIALADDVSTEAPLFLWVHYLDPHWPYEPPKPRVRDSVAACTKLRSIPRGDRETNGSGRSEAHLGACRDAYDQEVEFTDAAIGRLLHWLRKKGRLRNAAIVFTSDHGENFGEAGLYYSHGSNVHDASLRIPLIVAGPEIQRGSMRHDVVRLIDVAPFVLSVAAIPEAKRTPMQGVDHIVATRKGQGDARRPLLTYGESGGTLVRSNHTHLLSGRPRSGYCVNKGAYALCWDATRSPSLYHWKSDPELTKDLRDAQPTTYAEMVRARDRWTPGQTRERSVSDGRFKLVERPRFEGGYARTFYDTHRDRAEMHDVGTKYPKEYERLLHALERWTAAVPGYVQEALSDEAEAQLRALGYIE